MSTEIEDTKKRLAGLRNKIEELQGEVEREEAELVRLVRPFVPVRPFPNLDYEEDEDDDDEKNDTLDEDYEPPSDDLVIPGHQDCVKENPVGTCVYDDLNDPCHDFCLFCGAPEERL